MDDHLTDSILAKASKADLTEIVMKLRRTIQVQNELLAELQKEKDDQTIDNQNKLFELARQAIRSPKTMNIDDHSIHTRDISNSQVGQTLTNCQNMIQHQAPGELKSLLEKLEQEVAELLLKLPEERQEETAKDLKLLVEEATSAKPNRKWYSVSSEGLLEASKYVKDFSGNIAGTLGSVSKVLGLG
jgi:hypothetical protein